MIRCFCFFVALMTGATTAGEVEINAAMKKAAVYYRESVALNGGYVYYYSPDLSKRLGEGVAGESQIWVQDPGTRTVGMAFLGAWRATKDTYYLEAAKDAARALIHGQLESGAWTNSINFEEGGKGTARYRNGKGRKKGRNFSTLDDGISQGAMQFLMELDAETKFAEKDIHEASEIALEALLGAQFSNGAFPQGWDETKREANTESGKRANFPKYDWRTEGLIKEYWDSYNLNDGIALSVAKTLISARRIYQRDDCLKALKKLGDFLLMAQMPAPQRAWAQQYNDEMQPIWARKFEPPAIAGRESESVVAALMLIAEATRDARYLKTIPEALEYLEKSGLPDGKLARYYELQTNKPLYMERENGVYRLTHEDHRLPSHYGWKSSSRVGELRRILARLMAEGKLPQAAFSTNEKSPALEAVLKSLDEKGRWISRYEGEPLSGQPKFKQGEEYLHSGVFARNLGILGEALKR